MVVSLRTPSADCRIKALKSYITETFTNVNVFYVNLGDALIDSKENPYLVKIKQYADSILDILNKKRNQHIFPIGKIWTLSLK